MHPIAAGFGIESTTDCSEPPPGGDVGGGFLHDCLPFAVASTVTVAIASFNLISDWLVYRALLRLDIPAHARFVCNRTCVPDATPADIPCGVRLIPDIYFAFCIAASLAYFLNLVLYGAAYRQQRKNFIDRMDGVPFKRPLWHRHGDDVMLLSTFVVQDLPISCLLFALQVAISCDFYLPVGGAVFLVSVVGTCASVAWKLAFVTWKAKHAHRRAPRIVTGCVLVASLGIIVLNLTLLSPTGSDAVPGRYLGTKLFDKIAVDRWINTRNVVLAHPRTGARDVWPPPRYACNDLPRIIQLKDIVQSPDTLVVKHLQCEQPRLSFRTYFHPQHQVARRDGDRCVVVFHFLYSTRRRVIFYNYGYRFVHANNERVCGPPRVDPVHASSIDPCESSEGDDNNTTEDMVATESPDADDSPFRLAFCPVRYTVAPNVCGFAVVSNRDLLPVSLCT